MADGSVINGKTPPPWWVRHLLSVGAAVFAIGVAYTQLQAADKANGEQITTVQREHKEDFDSLDRRVSKNELTTGEIKKDISTLRGSIIGIERDVDHISKGQARIEKQIEELLRLQRGSQ